jgi:tRNA (cytidine56-2'-O)-methyltransferase
MINVLAIGRNTYSGNVDLCLTSRALGASEITFIGKKDPRLIRYVNSINKDWGGTFRVSFAKSFHELIKNSDKAIKVYLTRFGVPLQSKDDMIRTYKNIILITATKNIPELHKITDFNISVTSQPHCDTAAIAIFLHEYYKGRELAMHFENAKYKLTDSNNKTIAFKKKETAPHQK